MKIFAEADLRDFLDGRLQELRREVHAEDKNRLLNVNETEYISYLAVKYRIDPIMFDWEAISASDHEEMIRADNAYAGKSYPKQVITYHLPFTGLSELLRRASSTRLVWTADVDVRGNT